MTGVSQSSTGSKSLRRILDEIVAERRRQIGKGYDAAHDDKHNMGEMGNAAAIYAMTPVRRTWLVDPNAWIKIKELIWPWRAEFKPNEDRRRDLLCSCALLVAEIERLDRANG